MQLFLRTTLFVLFLSVNAMVVWAQPTGGIQSVDFGGDSDVTNNEGIYSIHTKFTVRLFRWDAANSEYVVVGTDYDEDEAYIAASSTATLSIDDDCYLGTGDYLVVGNTYSLWWIDGEDELSAHDYFSDSSFSIVP